MNKLLAFGCSHTYGESLPDCLPNDPMPPPSQFAWPNLLAKKLDRECVNLSRSGSSNKQIHYNLVNTNFDKDDIVVVLWTHHVRTCFMQDDPHENNGFNKSNLLPPVHVKPLVPAYTKKFKQNPRWRRLYNYNYYDTFYTEGNSRYETQLSIDHAYKHLEAKGIANFHFTFDGKHADGHTSSSKIFKTYSWFTAPVNNLNLIEDTGQDGKHPGLLAHADMAEKMLVMIEK